MKKKHFAALLFAAGLAVTGMTLPASAAQANDTLTQMSEVLSESDASTDTADLASGSEDSENDKESDIAEDAKDSSDEKDTEKTEDSQKPSDSEKPDTPDDSEEPEDPAGTTTEVLYDKETDTWNICKDGKVLAPFDGFQETEKGWIYIVDGTYQADYTGLAEGEAQGEETLWYVSNGAIDFTYNSITNDQTGWYKIKNGKFDADYTGVSNNKNGWWRVVNGVVDFNCNSIESNENGRWYIRNGQVRFDYTGISNDANGWWRILNGKVDEHCNSVENNENGWWYIRNGQVDFGFNGVAQNSNGWWYIYHGKVQFNSSGTYSEGARIYYVSNGRVTSSNYYLPQTVINLPSGGYNLSTANIGLKVIKVNQAVLGNSSERYTSATASAVQRFQTIHGLYPSGTVDLATWKAMGYSENDWYNLGTYRTPIKVANGAKRNDRVNAMLATAAEYANAGTGYKVGCSGTPGTYVDCSGLIYQCLYSAGINPSSNIVDHALAIHEYTSANLAADQWLGLSIASYNLQRGDLIFYARDGRSSVCHVAIYAGNGWIYDSWPGRGVTYRSMNIGGYHAIKYTRIF